MTQSDEDHFEPIRCEASKKAAQKVQTSGIKKEDTRENRALREREVQCMYENHWQETINY